MTSPPTRLQAFAERVTREMHAALDADEVSEPDPAAARAAGSRARQAATDAHLRNLRKAAQSAPPTPEQMAELRAARQREADLRRGGR